MRGVGLASATVASLGFLFAGCALLQPTEPSRGVYQELYRDGSALVTVTMDGTEQALEPMALVGRAGYLDEHMGVGVIWADEEGWQLSIQGTVTKPTDADVYLRSPQGIVGSGTIGKDCDLKLHPGMPVTFAGTVECRATGERLPPDETDHDFTVTFRAGP